MPLLSETIPNLNGGVSQKAPAQRDQTRGTEQINGLATAARGLSMRPPTHHKATISDVPLASCSLHPFTADSGDFIAVFADGMLKVYEADSGAEVTVSFPDGTDYLAANEQNAAAIFRAVTAGARTWFLNRTVKTQRAARKSAAQQNEALIVVRQAPPGAQYTVTVEGDAHSFSVPTDADKDDPEYVAGLIADALAFQFTSVGVYQVERYGATVWMRKADGSEFTVRLRDSMDGDGLLLIEDKVSRVEQLPAKARDSYVVMVEGSKAESIDDAWYRYDAAAEKWRETVKPGEQIGLESSTLPHALEPVTSMVQNAPHILSDDPTIKPYGGLGNTQYAPVSETQDGTAVPGGLHRLDNNSAFYADLAEAPVALTPTKVRFKYFISTAFVTNGNTVTLTFELHDGTDWTKLGEKRYTNESGGEGVFEEEVEAAAGYDFRMTVAYEDAPSTTFPYTTAFLRLSETPFEYEVLNQKLVTFPLDSLYPDAGTYRVTVDGVDFDYTPTEDVKGEGLASGLAQAVAGGTGLSASPVGNLGFSVARTDGVPPEVTFSRLYSDVYHGGPSVALVPDALVGTTLHNRTAGTSGVVTANGRTWIAGVAFAESDQADPEVPAEQFVFRALPWADRQVGSIELDPFPAFVGRPIADLFVHRGRLGLACGQDVVLSEAGDSLNLFRRTVLALLDSDPIHLRPSSGVQGDFHSHVETDERLFLWTDKQPVELAGEPALTPTTARLRALAVYANSKEVKPVAFGNRIAFLTDHNGHAQVSLFGQADQHARTFVAQSLTEEDVPEYMKGDGRGLVAFPNLGLFFVLTQE